MSRAAGKRRAPPPSPSVCLTSPRTDLLLSAFLRAQLENLHRLHTASTACLVKVSLASATWAPDPSLPVPCTSPLFADLPLHKLPSPAQPLRHVLAR
jgi:hypothetical protein